MSEKINDLIKHHVTTHEADVDPQEIWEGILAKQAPPRRRPFLLPLFSVAALAIVGGWLIFNNLNSPTQEISSTENQSTLLEATPIKSPTLATHQADNTTENWATSLTSEKTNESISKTNKQIVQEISLRPQNNKPQLKNKINTAENFETTTTKTSIFPLTDQVALASPEPTSLLAGPQANSNLNLTEVILLSRHLGNIQIPDRIIMAVPSVNVSRIPIKPQSKKFERSFRLFAFGTYSLFNKSYSTLGDSEGYTTDRRRSETPVDAFGATVLIEYPLTKSLSLSTGVAYQKAYEKFNYEGSYLRDLDGNSFSNYLEEYTEPLYENVHRHTVQYNNLTFVDIPLMVNLHKSIGNLEWMLSGGAAINIYRHLDGLVVSQEGFPVEFNNLESDIKSGLTYSGGLNLNWHLSSRLSMMGGSSYSIRSISEKELKQRHKYLNFNLGLGYKFN